jgi:acetylornithine deacetylase/succinyl-diaminopimelate desuccinylase-like protein
MRVFSLALLFISQIVLAQSPEIMRIREFREKSEHIMINEYMNFLSIPNLATDSVNMKRNTDMIMDMMKKRGIENVQLLQAKTKGVPPAVYGEVKVPGAKQTIVFYAHYDGQPTDSTKWIDGLHPFNPRLTSGPLYDKASFIPLPSANSSFDPQWRIYARGASDDKAGVISILNAYAAIKSTGQLPASNIKFFFEGEEEKGSDNLFEILEKNKSLLQSDLWVICDGPVSGVIRTSN